MRFPLALSICALTGFLAAKPPGALGQNLSIGIMAGGSVTDGFQTESTPAAMRYFSTSKDYLIGPTLEWNFSSRWSIEADGLFRELHLGLASINQNGGLGSTNPEPVVTWEFPVLAKYRFTSARVRPFIEGGASFRTSGNLNGTNPSHYGFTAGAGVEMHAKNLNFAPVVRYTRWADDETNQYQARSSPNQLELGVGVNATPESNAHPLGMHIAVGGFVGVALTDDIPTSGFAYSSGLQSFSQTTSARKGVIGGPALELRLPANFFVEADAVYAPLRFTTVSSFNGMNTVTEHISIGDWELPLLAKWRFGTRFGRPFIEAGPGFRTGAGDLSHYGVTAGAGFETHFRALRIAPTFRYSHWAADHYFGTGSISNQVEFFAAVYL